MHTRKSAVILAAALLAACQASPTDPTGTTQLGVRRLDGFTMGSGNVVQPTEDGTATTTGAVVDSVTERSGFTLGSGN